VPVNLEIKARIKNLDAAAGVAHSMAAKHYGVIIQTDTYFHVSRGRLKLREIEGSTAELIYYERDETTSRRSSSFERYPAPSASLLAKILAKAYGVKGIVSKSRDLFIYGGTRIHLDRVENLGNFIEFELPLEGAAGKDELEYLISRFGIGEDDFLLNSYVDLLERT